jgi:hypothetical protein
MQSPRRARQHLSSGHKVESWSNSGRHRALDFTSSSLVSRRCPSGVQRRVLILFLRCSFPLSVSTDPARAGHIQQIPSSDFFSTDTTTRTTSVDDRECEEKRGLMCQTGREGERQGGRRARESGDGETMPAFSQAWPRCLGCTVLSVHAACTTLAAGAQGGTVVEGRGIVVSVTSSLDGETVAAGSGRQRSWSLDTVRVGRTQGDAHSARDQEEGFTLV